MITVIAVLLVLVFIVVWALTYKEPNRDDVIVEDYPMERGSIGVFFAVLFFFIVIIGVVLYIQKHYGVGKIEDIQNAILGAVESLVVTLPVRVVYKKVVICMACEKVLQTRMLTEEEFNLEKAKIDWLHSAEVVGTTVLLKDVCEVCDSIY